MILQSNDKKRLALRQGSDWGEGSRWGEAFKT